MAIQACPKPKSKEYLERILHLDIKYKIRILYPKLRTSGYSSENSKVRVY